MKILCKTCKYLAGKSCRSLQKLQALQTIFLHKYFEILQDVRYVSAQKSIKILQEIYQNLAQNPLQSCKIFLLHISCKKNKTLQGTVRVKIKFM